MRVRRTLALCLAAALLTGCSGDGGGTPEAAPATPTAPAAAVTSTDADEHLDDGHSLTVPARSAGPLGRDDVPVAEDIGEDWEPFSHPGGAEEGFEGNGDFVRQRDPGEVVASVVPLGCPGVDRAPRLPRPEHALEATYRDERGRPAVALVLAYREEHLAVSALDTMARMLRTCTPPKPEERVSMFRPVVEIRRADEQAVWDVRRYVGPGAPPDRWDEVVVRVGDRVALLAVARPGNAPPADLAGLDAALRTQLT